MSIMKHGSDGHDRWLRGLSIVLAAASLCACASQGDTSAAAAASAPDYPIYGTVVRVIGRDTPLPAAAPCLAGHTAELEDGEVFVAIRYRRWASHFNSTAYAAVPAGMTVRTGTRLEIIPGHCTQNQLSQVVREIAR